MDILHYNTATCGRSSTAHPKTPAPPAHAEEQTPATERRTPSGAKEVQEGSSSKDASEGKRKRNGAERNEIEGASSGRDAVPRDEQANKKSKRAPRQAPEQTPLAQTQDHALDGGQVTQ